jgi:hypothetical protein
MKLGKETRAKLKVLLTEEFTRQVPEAPKKDINDSVAYITQEIIDEIQVIKDAVSERLNS